jgi:hypothetical protein
MDSVSPPLQQKSNLSSQEEDGGRIVNPKEKDSQCT